MSRGWFVAIRRMRTRSRSTSCLLTPKRRPQVAAKRLDLSPNVYLAEIVDLIMRDQLFFVQLQPVNRLHVAVTRIGRPGCVSGFLRDVTRAEVARAL